MPRIFDNIEKQPLPALRETINVSDCRIRKNSLAGRAEMALQEAVERAIEEYRKAGQPLAIWRDGGVLLVHPDRLRRVGIRESRAAYDSKKRDHR